MSRNHLKLVELPTLQTEWHDFACRCDICDPVAPSAAADLATTQIAKLGLLGIAVGLVIIFAMDPRAAAHALFMTIGF